MSSSPAPDARRVGQLELSRVFRVTTRTIQRWHEDGLPREETSTGPTYDLADVVAWALERERSRARAHDDMGYEEALARKTGVQAEREALKLAVEKRQLVAMADVEALLRPLVEMVDTALRNAPGRYASELASVAKTRTPVALRVLADIMERIRGDLHALADDDGNVRRSA